MEKHGDHLLFFDPLTPYLYQIDSKLNITPFITFDLGTYRLGSDYWAKEGDAALEELFSHGFYTCRNFSIAENYMFLHGDFVRDANDMEKCFSVYDFNRNEVLTKILQVGTIDEAMLNVFTMKNEEIISLGDGYTLKYLDGHEKLDQFEISDEKYYLVYWAIKK